MCQALVSYLHYLRFHCPVFIPVLPQTQLQYDCVHMRRGLATLCMCVWQWCLGGGEGPCSLPLHSAASERGGVGGHEEEGVSVFVQNLCVAWVIN